MTEAELLKLANYSQTIQTNGCLAAEVYSAGWVLKEYAYYPKGWSIYCMSAHGPHQWDYPQNFALLSHYPAMLYYSQRSVDAWKRVSSKPCYVVPSPNVIYRKRNNIERNPDAKGTIFYVSHSTGGINMELRSEDVIASLREIEPEFGPFTICLHFVDIQKGLHKPFLEAGFECTTAGHWHDPEFIPRFYDDLKRHQYAMSNRHGSQIFYAVEMGIPFSIYGPQPRFKNVSDPSLAKGDWDSRKLHKQIQKVTEMFEGLHTEISEEQRKLSEAELGVHTGLGRLATARVLYSSLLKFKISNFVGRLNMKALPQFPLKEQALLLLDGFRMRALKKEPRLPFLIKRKQFFDGLIRKGYKAKRKGGFNFIKPNAGAYAGYEIRIRRDTSDYHVFQQVVVEEEYKNLCEEVKKYLAGDKVKNIVDAGSNIGLTSLYFTKQFPKANIVAIEPDASNYQSIQKNLELNGLSQVEVKQAALWHNNEDLVVEGTGRGDSHWALGVRPSEEKEKTVPGLTVMDILEQQNWNHIDILKIDIEGAERFVFEDEDKAAEFLSRVKFIALEIHDEHNIREWLLGLLSRNGFEYFEEGETTVGRNTKLVN